MYNELIDLQRLSTHTINMMKKFDFHTVSRQTV